MAVTKMTEDSSDDDSWQTHEPCEDKIVIAIIRFLQMYVLEGTDFRFEILSVKMDIKGDFTNPLQSGYYATVLLEDLCETNDPCHLCVVRLLITIPKGDTSRDHKVRLLENIPVSIVSRKLPEVWPLIYTRLLLCENPLFFHKQDCDLPHQSSIYPYYTKRKMIDEFREISCIACSGRNVYVHQNTGELHVSGEGWGNGQAVRMSLTMPCYSMRKASAWMKRYGLPPIVIDSSSDEEEESVSVPLSDSDESPSEAADRVLSSLKEDIELPSPVAKSEDPWVDTKDTWNERCLDIDDDNSMYKHIYKSGKKRSRPQVELASAKKRRHGIPVSQEM